jgi:hypothetical protein
LLTGQNIGFKGATSTMNAKKWFLTIAAVALLAAATSAAFDL